MRVLLQDAGRIANLHRIKPIKHALASCTRVKVQMQCQQIVHLAANAQDRIQRSQRVLRYQRHLFAEILPMH